MWYQLLTGNLNTHTNLASAIDILIPSFGPGSCQCGAFLLCFVLAEWFQVPSLAQSCISLLPAHLTMESAKQVLHFSKAINSQPLEHMCCTYMNTSS